MKSSTTGTRLVAGSTNQQSATWTLGILRPKRKRGRPPKIPYSSILRGILIKAKLIGRPREILERGDEIRLLLTIDMVLSGQITFDRTIKTRQDIIRLV